MEPARLAMLGGSICATLAMVYVFIRQQLGMVVDPGQALVRVGLAFVISYAVTGLFVYYLLWVAEKELNHKSSSKKESAESDDEQDDLETAEEAEEEEPGEP